MAGTSQRKDPSLSETRGKEVRVDAGVCVVGTQVRIRERFGLMALTLSVNRGAAVS